jgi:hypothetical protein
VYVEYCITCATSFAGLAPQQFTIHTGTKPLQRCPSLADQGVRHEQTSHLFLHLLGGATTPACLASEVLGPTPQMGGYML